MELLLTFEVPEAPLRAEIAAELDPFLPVARFQVALIAWAQRRGVSTPEHPVLLGSGSSGEHRVLDQTISVFDSGLVSGNTVKLVDWSSVHRFVGAADPTDAAGTPGLPRVSIDVTSGPDAGRTIELGPGRYLVGRSPDAQIQVHDPAVSWTHFTLDVAPDLTVTVEPNPEASNATFVSARELRAPRSLEREEAVFAGNTQLVLRGAVFATLGRRDRLGQVAFNPLPYRRPVIKPRRLDEIQHPPERPGERRFSLLALLVPLVGAVLIVALTHQLVFIVLALLSPLMMVSNHVSEGRSSRRNYRRDRADFQRRVETRATEVSAALEAERRERLLVAPDVGFLSRQAAGRLGRLWERPRSSPDFLELRLGLGTRHSMIETPIEPGGDLDLRDEAAAKLAHHEQLSIVPVTTSLDSLGVMGLYGDREPVRQLAAALVLQAVLLHSPEQLVVAAAVASDEIAEWSWLKWLPHTRSATSPLEGPHLVDERRVDDLVSRLAGVVIDRAGRDRAEAPNWPRLLFVLRESSEPSRAALAALLDVAPAAGIVCLWVGDGAAQLPRQCAATVKVARPEEDESLLRFTDPDRADQAFSAEG